MSARGSLLICGLLANTAVTGSYVALLVIGGEYDSAPIVIAALLGCDCVVPLLAGSWIGAWVDGRSPCRVVHVSCVTLAGLLAAMAACADVLAGLLVLAVCAGGAAGALNTALQASLVRSAPGGDVGALAGRFSAAAQLGMVLGPVLAGAAIAASSARVALLAAAAVAATCALLALSLPSGGADLEAGDEGRRSTWRAIRAYPGMAVLVGCVATASLAGAMMNVAEPLLARELGSPGVGLAVLVAIYAALFAVGALAAGRATGRPRQGLFVAGLVVQAAGLAASAAAPSLAWAAAAFALTGAGNGWSVTQQRMIVIEMVAARVHGAAFSLIYAANSAAFLLALIVAAAVASFGGARDVFWLSAAGMTLAAAVAAVSLTRRPATRI